METTIVSFFDDESASCGLLRGDFDDVVDETNTTDSFALANSTASTINFKDDDLGSKEELTCDEGDLRAPPTREPKGRPGPTHESRISILSHCETLTDESYSLGGESTNFCVQCCSMAFDDCGNRSKWLSNVFLTSYSRKNF